MSGGEFEGLSITALRRAIGEIEERLSLAMIRRDAISNPEIASRIKADTELLDRANDRLSVLRAAGRGKRPERKKVRGGDASEQGQESRPEGQAQ